MYIVKQDTFSLQPSLQMGEMCFELWKVSSGREYGEVTSFTSPPLGLEHPNNSSHTTITERKEYIVGRAIRQSILCNVLFAKEFERTATALNCCQGASSPLQPAPSELLFVSFSTQQNFRTGSKVLEELPLRRSSSGPCSWSSKL
jgi:hypothetical protein